MSHGALPFRHHDRCAYLAIFLRLNATLRWNPRLHVLGHQGAAGTGPVDDTDTSVEYRWAHRHRH